MKNETESILILPDVRSALNVGSLFRTADAVGISKIILTGVTPRPTDQFGRVQKDIAKAALGAETWVPWEYKNALVPAITALKKQGFTIVAIEQDDRSIDYRKIKLPSRVVFIVGTEVSGLPKNVLARCDHVAEIPLHGKKESLNVSVAAGIALFRMLRN